MFFVQVAKTILKRIPNGTLQGKEMKRLSKHDRSELLFLDGHRLGEKKKVTNKGL